MRVFLFLFTERLFTTISEPGTGYNFQCNVCLRKIKTLCRHALFEFLSRRTGSSGAHKRTLVAGKEELNFEDLQEGNNLLFKYVPGGFITGEKKSSTKNRQKL